MPRGRKRAHVSDQTVVVQTSDFFRLPRELRDQIYSDCVADINTISLRAHEHSILYAPALSLVCRQLRNEYETIYKNEAIKTAETVHIYTNDFTYNSDIIWQLNNQLSTDLSRVIYPVYHVYLTNFYREKDFDMSGPIGGGVLHHIRKGVEVAPLQFEITIHWNPRSFDVDHFKRTVSRVDWFSSVHDSEQKSEGLRNWPKFITAIEDAIQRYEVRGSTRTRNERNASVVS